MSTRGARIKRERERRRMSQADLSVATGVSQRTIGRIEADQNEGGRSITILEDYLGITGGPDESPPPREVEERPTIGKAMAHLAEAMRLLAQLEAQSGERYVPPTPARVTFPRSAAPSGRRRDEGGEHARGVD